VAELLGRKPLFPGKDYVDMLKKIVDKIGNPAVEDQDHVSEKVSILPSFSVSDDGSIHPCSRAHAQLWGEGHARARGNRQDSVRGRKKPENEVEIMRKIRCEGGRSQKMRLKSCARFGAREEEVRK
jgi:hypothetical protein